MTQRTTVAITLPTEAGLTVDQHIQTALRASQAGIAALFVDDTVRGARARVPYDPFTLAHAVASRVPGLGLVVEVTPDSGAPYSIARKLGTLDIVTGGWAGWRVSGGDAAWGDELVEVVNGLLDSYADDAVVRDQEEGIYYRRDGRRSLNHVGRHFSVAGPLNLSRPPQGHPVLFHELVDADESGDSGPSALENADVLIAPGDSQGQFWWRADDIDQGLEWIRSQENAEGLGNQERHWGILIPTPTLADAHRVIDDRARDAPTFRDRLGLSRPERT